MRISGSAVLHAEPERVYAALHDPAVLAGAIPGCRAFADLGGGRYRMSLTAGVASVKGSYDGEIALSEQRPPESFAMRARAAGTPGTVDVTVQVRLAGGGDGTTRLDYEADAAVGGMVGGVGQRMLVGASKRMAGRFFAGVDEVLTGARALGVAAAEVAPAGVAGDGVSSAGVAGAGAGPVQAGPQAPGALPAALTGAAIALAGVLVGWLIGRGGRS